MTEPKRHTPIVILLEIKPGAASVDITGFGAMPGSGDRAGSEPVPTMSSTSAKKNKSTSPETTNDTKQRQNRGARTYSEVVVETIDKDARKISEPSSSATDPTEMKQLAFISGHMKVERTEGILHFYKHKKPRENDIRTICMVGVPSFLSCQDVLNFFSPAIPSIERIKVVRDATPHKYMMIIRFKSSEDAELFYSDFNDQQYNTLADDRCLLLFVDRVDLMAEAVEADLVELPTCAVCLERMDDGVISIYCRHSFHAVCIQKCTDTICPVCRSTQTPEMQAKQRCSECDQSTDLWICLICGNVACGRYREAHARRHFEETSHTFAQEVGGNRVWDYAGDNYVHRLIQAEQDGKLVSFERPGAASNLEGDEKVEAVTLEYTCLLTNQLEDQRRFFERKLYESERAKSTLEKMALAQMDDLEAQVKRAVEECEKLREELATSQTAKAATEKKHHTAQAKLKKLTSDLEEERSLNAIVRSDAEKWIKQVKEMKDELQATKDNSKKEITELQEQMRDLMMHLEGQQKIQDGVEHGGITREEVEQSSVVVGPASEKKQRRKSSQKK